MMLTLLHSKLFDVGDIPVLTFGALKTGLIKWSLKLYVRFYVFNVFFVIQKNIHFYVFFNCCTRFLEDWLSASRRRPAAF